MTRIIPPIYARRPSLALLILVHLLIASPVVISTAAHAQAAATIRFDLPRDGGVSLGVYHADGRMLRELLRGDSLPAGEHSVEWDGLDRWGKPAPAGEYRWKLLSSQGFEPEFLFSLGTNTPTGPLDMWVGNHAPVCTVAADETGLYLGSGLVEGPPLIVKQSLDAKTRIWEAIFESRWC